MTKKSKILKVLAVITAVLFSISILIGIVFSIHKDEPKTASADTSYTVSGQWLFNTNVTINSSYTCFQTVSFTSNNISYIKFYVGNVAKNLNYYTSDDNYTIVYKSSDGGWAKSAYRTVDFGSTPQIVSSIFYNFLTANATQLSVSYNIGYDIRSSDGASGSITGLPSTAFAGDTISFNIAPDLGSYIYAIDITAYDLSDNISVEVIKYGSYQFVMPESDIDIVIYLNKDGAGAPDEVGTPPMSYNIGCILLPTSTGTGTFHIPFSAVEGETVTFTVMPSQGSYVSNIFVHYNAYDDSVIPTDLGNGSYSFVMADCTVNVNIEFSLICEPIDPPVNPPTDPDLYSISGVWVLNDTIDSSPLTKSSYSCSLSVTIDGVSMKVTSFSLSSSNVVSFLDSNGVRYILAFGNSNTALTLQDGVKTWDFGSTYQAIEKDLYLFITTNATQTTASYHIGYDIVSPDGAFGSVTNLPSAAFAGGVISFNIVPGLGSYIYAIDIITYDLSDNIPIKVIKYGSYQFVMPETDIDIVVYLNKDGPGAPGEVGTMPFEEYSYNAGYNAGYNDGLNMGLSSSITNPVLFFLTPIHDFLTINLFGSFSLGMLLNVVLFVGLALIFIRMFAGG